MNKEDEIHMRAEELEKELVEDLKEQIKEKGIPIESLSIDIIDKYLEERRFLPIVPNSLMLDGIILDTITMSALKQVYLNVKGENKERFNNMLQSPKLFLHLIENIWRWFK